MDIKLKDQDIFEVKEKSDGLTHISLPSAGLSLCFTPEEYETVKNEANRFLKETLTHTHYVLERFKCQYSLIMSTIETLKHRGYWGIDGFTDLSKGVNNQPFNFNVEVLLEDLIMLFRFNKDLREITNKLPIIKPGEEALPQWPSIAAVSNLQRFKKDEYQGEWQIPFRFTSSSSLAGFFKPVIFHDNSLSIGLNGSKVKIELKGEDSLLLLSVLLTDNELSELYTAKKAWLALVELEAGIRRLFERFKSNGYDIETECFYENISIDGVHNALHAIYEEIKSESGMKSANEIANKIKLRGQ